MHIQLSDHALLRPLEESDAEEVFALVEANRDHLSPWLPWAADQDFERTRNFLRTTAEKRDRGEAFDCAIVLDGRIVGCAGFPVIEHALVGTIGYWLAKEHEGRGLVTRAIGALIDHGFGELGLHRLEIRAAASNARSRAIPERLGFQLEGVLREAELVGDEYQDLAVYGLVATQMSAVSGPPGARPK
ncbi:MAG TPA: GNAT family protein [Thermoleophilaceae bacterium]|nr:GNAT family protein [Thermoleophilaceae bacterium]